MENSRVTSIKEKIAIDIASDVWKAKPRVLTHPARNKDWYQTIFHGTKKLSAISKCIRRNSILSFICSVTYKLPSLIETFDKNLLNPKNMKKKNLILVFFPSESILLPLGQYLRPWSQKANLLAMWYYFSQSVRCYFTIWFVSFSR